MLCDKYNLRSSSNIETDDLGRGHLKFLIYASLQVLIQQRLQFFVLLVEQARLLDQVLTLDKHLVVLTESLVERAPHGQLLSTEDGDQFFPEHFLLFLVTLCLFFS